MTFAWLTDAVTTDLDRAVHYTLLWGLDALELRLIGDGRVPHVNEEKLRRRLVESELSVASIQPGMFEGALSDRAGWMNDLAQSPESFSFCRRIGCELVVVSTFQAEADGDVSAAVDPLRRLSDSAARFDVRIAVINERDTLAPTSAALAELLEAVGSENVGAAWSPATAVASGEEVGEGMGRLRGKLELIRCSDVRRGQAGALEAAPLGEGAVGWDRLLARLQPSFDGTISLEGFAAPKKKQAVRDATWLIHTLRKARSSARSS